MTTMFSTMPLETLPPTIAPAAADPEFVEAADGKLTSYALYGATGGRPVYFLHGFPGSRLQAQLVHEEAKRRHVCLVAFDRPGFGRSSPRPGRRILDVADDIARLADALGHDRFDVLGVSCGGAYALAAATRIPDRIRRIGLMAGMGPMDVPAIRVGQHRMLAILFALAKRSRLLAGPLLLPDYLLFRRAPELALAALSSMMTGPDRRLLESDPGLAQVFGRSLREAYRQGLGACLLEAQLIASSRGFELSAVTVPVEVYQGGHDWNVPPAMGRFLAENLPRGRLHFHPDEGHLSIVVKAFPHFVSEV